MIKSISSELLEEYPAAYAGEVLSSVSETVPNQAVSAKDAMARALRGLPVYGVGQSTDMPYDGEQLHDERGVYKGESFDYENQPPKFNDELDAIDFLDHFQSSVHARMKKAAPSTPPQVPAPVTPEQPPKGPEMTE